MSHTRIDSGLSGLENNIPTNTTSEDKTGAASDNKPTGIIDLTAPVGQYGYIGRLKDLALMLGLGDSVLVSNIKGKRYRLGQKGLALTEKDILQFLNSMTVSEMENAASEAKRKAEKGGVTPRCGFEFCQWYIRMRKAHFDSEK